MISIVHHKNYILLSGHRAINNYSMNTKSLIVCANFLVLASIEDKREMRLTIKLRKYNRLLTHFYFTSSYIHYKESSNI